MVQNLILLQQEEKKTRNHTRTQPTRIEYTLIVFMNPALFWENVRLDDPKDIKPGTSKSALHMLGGLMSPFSY